MIDIDGIERPDNPHQHTMKPPKRRRKYDGGYTYKKKNIFYLTLAGFIRCLAWIFLPIFSKIKYGYKIIGKNNLKKIKDTGAVLVSNHVLFADAIIISACAFRTRKVRIVIMSSNMDIPVAGKILEMMGCYPIGEGISGAKNFIKYSDDLLQNKKPVLIFPEIAMWNGYKGLRPFDKGAFKIAARNNVPVVPMVFTFKTKKKRNGKLKYKVFLTIGEPVTTNQEKSNDKVEDLNNQTTNYFNKVMDDFYGENREKYIFKENETNG